MIPQMVQGTSVSTHKYVGVSYATMNLKDKKLDSPPIDFHIIYYRLVDDENYIYAKCIDNDLLAFGLTLDEAEKCLLEAIGNHVLLMMENNSIEELFRHPSPQKEWKKYNSIKHEVEKEILNRLRLLHCEQGDGAFYPSPVNVGDVEYERFTLRVMEKWLLKAA